MGRNPRVPAMAASLAGALGLAACADPAPGIYLDVRAPAGATLDRVEIYYTTNEPRAEDGPVLPGEGASRPAPAEVWRRDYAPGDDVALARPRGSYTVRVAAAAPGAALPYLVVVGYAGGAPVGVAELASQPVPASAALVYPLVLDPEPVAAGDLALWGRATDGLGGCLRWRRADQPTFVVRDGDADCDAMFADAPADQADCDDLRYCDPTAGTCASPGAAPCRIPGVDACAAGACVNTEGADGVVHAAQACSAAACIGGGAALCAGECATKPTLEERLACAAGALQAQGCNLPAERTPVGSNTVGLPCPGAGIRIDNGTTHYDDVKAVARGLPQGYSIEASVDPSNVTLRVVGGGGPLPPLPRLTVALALFHGGQLADLARLELVPQPTESCPTGSDLVIECSINLPRCP